MERNAFDRWTCSTQKAVDTIGDKWTLFVIREFVFGKPTNGFNELLRLLTPISSRTLSLKLKKLVSLRILSREENRSKQRKVSYTITAKGLALKKALNALAEWHTLHHK
jgi:DNA-binding HxlR family transcriptional regulator